ncbi:hypothetical protein MIR68_010989 [Amoeboaphelidium protococcarum]|nr:hypothetical protein MIR68_010989 [Amoeboaphelidium protococcarum]
MVFFNYFCAIFTDPGTPVLQSEALMSQTEQSTVSQRKVCRKCDRLKPERAHHCSNHRYFYLFMVYLWLGTIYFLFWIWRPFMDVISGSNLEIYGYHNVKWIVLCFMLAATLMVALGGFVAWTSYLVLSNQTTIEFYNNTYEHEAAKSRGQSYRNPYDCGRWMNLRLFFSVGSRYKWWHAFLPVRVRAYSDGYSYLKESQFVQSQLVDLYDFDLDSYNAKLQ